MVNARQWLAVIRLRGSVGIDKEREYVFKLMHLTRKNHAILVQDTPSNIGSIQKIKDYATWGEVSLDTVSLLLEKRGRLVGGERLTENYVKNFMEYTSIEEVAKALFDSRIKIEEVPTIKPIFRLHPPRKGFHGSIKKPYPEGELGYRGAAINNLIARMI